MRKMGLSSAKRRAKHVLMVAGAALTLAASAVPVQASAHGGKPAGHGTGHKIG